MTIQDKLAVRKAGTVTAINGYHQRGQSPERLVGSVTAIALLAPRQLINGDSHLEMSGRIIGDSHPK